LMDNWVFAVKKLKPSFSINLTFIFM
jgi:hypothetical protein